MYYFAIQKVLKMHFKVGEIDFASPRIVELDKVQRDVSELEKTQSEARNGT